MEKIILFVMMALTPLAGQSDFTAGFLTDRQYFIIDANTTWLDLSLRLSREQGIIFPDFVSLSHGGLRFGPILSKGALSRLMSPGSASAGSSLWTQGSGLGINPDPLAAFHPDFGFAQEDFSLLCRTREESSILGFEAGADGFSFAGFCASVKSKPSADEWFSACSQDCGEEGLGFLVKGTADYGSFYSSVSRWEGLGFGFRAGGTLKAKDKESRFEIAADASDSFWRTAEGQSTDYFIFTSILMEENFLPFFVLSLNAEAGLTQKSEWTSSAEAKVTSQWGPLEGFLEYKKKGLIDGDDFSLTANLSYTIENLTCGLDLGVENFNEYFAGLKLKAQQWDIEWSAEYKNGKDSSAQFSAESKNWKIRAQLIFPKDKDWIYDVLIRIDSY